MNLSAVSCEHHKGTKGNSPARSSAVLVSLVLGDDTRTALDVLLVSSATSLGLVAR